MPQLAKNMSEHYKLAKKAEKTGGEKWAAKDEIVLR